jgi:O-acetyl-ADP-ribose deacetylase
MYYLYYGDICDLHVDAIVDPAHNSIVGHTGLSGHIHKRGGNEMIEKIDTHGDIKTGEVFVTYGYDLPAKHVIHTLGPMWMGGARGEMTKLEACYINCIDIAIEKKYKQVAFPAIGTGFDGFPPQEAIDMAIRVVTNYLDGRENELDVIFCCFNDDVYHAYIHELALRAIDYEHYDIIEPDEE